MLGWLRDTKKVYDGTTYNCYVGTAQGQSNKSLVEVTVAEGENEAQVIANALADVITEMTDYNRDFNDYKQLRRYSEDEIKIIRKECEKKLTDLIDEMSKDSQIKLNEFIDIRNGINSESLKLDKINALLEEKKKELSAKLAEETKKSIDSSLGAGATDKTGSALQGLQG